MKQDFKVKYFGCVLDQTRSAEEMAFSFVNKTNHMLKNL